MNKLAFIGSAGIPNRYGGFESFIESCAPALVKGGFEVIVTCDRRLYSEKNEYWGGVKLEYLNVPANGAWSTLHDFVAFLKIYRRVNAIVILGVSAGPFFLFFRAMAALSGVRLIVNIDGLEWRRRKFGVITQIVLFLFDRLAQWCCHSVVFDNLALGEFLSVRALKKAVCIPYPGSQAAPRKKYERSIGAALTVCRIEPENNVEMLIEGAIRSNIKKYTFIGNWNSSEYGRNIRRKYSDNPRLELLDAIYDVDVIERFRAESHIYLHGHSVGGTNPSLIEMLFFEAIIICYDCSFNRESVAGSAHFFVDEKELSEKINKALNGYECPRGDLSR
jgi:glycosyltransferase involved in cell wall biosynthesis